MKTLLLASFIALACGLAVPVPAAAVDRPPNFLLIVADDMGYTDLGAYGSEIPTPNLDSLARKGVLFSNFYSAPTCSPARAMLLTGMDYHRTGLGTMAETLSANQKDKPGYEGHLSSHVASAAELLKHAGYRTYMAGKWHLGLTPDSNPAARGFDRSFVLLQGGAGHFANRLPLFGPGKAKFTEDGKPLDHLPPDFYSSRSYARKIISYLRADAADARPFFAYLAFQAPHWPLQAPPESIAAQRGRYDQGYDVLHDQRVARLEKLGIVPKGMETFPRLPNEPAWRALSAEQKRIEARKMEIYAAMVADMDRYVGEVIEYLASSKQLDNTFIFFLSDNGAEGHHLDRFRTATGAPDELPAWVAACCDNSYGNMGRANSYLWYGPNWARASVGPWRMSKSYTFEGGIRVPAFAYFPKAARQGLMSDAIVTSMDVLPTMLDLAGAKLPGPKFEGRDVLPIQGTSMLSLLQGQERAVHPPDYEIGRELFARRSLRRGDWKIVYEPYSKLLEPRKDGIKAGTWLLFNLESDPAELNDVAASHPDLVNELRRAWDGYARDNGVIIPETFELYQ